METTLGAAASRTVAMEWVRLLAEEVGPRRPTGPAERRAAELVAERLTKSGLTVERREFDGYSSFAVPQAPALVVALSGLPLLRRRPWVAAGLASAGAGLASAGAALTTGEDGLITRPLTRAIAQQRSQNVVASIEPREAPKRTVCLVCHLDSSRSGLMFHPGFLPFLHGWIATQSAAFALTVAGPVLSRLRLGRRILAGAYGVLLAGLGVLIEREIRGADVPGANDNASGVAAVAAQALELKQRPLEHTRVICLFTGCEEAGLLGADAFIRDLESRGEEWRTWTFVNFDGVAAPATLRFLREEGVLRKWTADAHLARIAEAISQRRPELGLEGTYRNAGLTYDTTPVMARGGRAITLSAQDETIPNYHSPTDAVENADPAVLERAIEVGREMLAAIDRGEAD